MFSNKKMKSKYYNLLIWMFFIGAIFGGIMTAIIIPKPEPEIEYITKTKYITEYVYIKEEEISEEEATETEETTESEIEEATEYIPSWSEEEAEMLAKVLYGEARGIPSTMEKAAVVWCILNRVGADIYGCGDSIEYVVTFPNQFVGYNPNHPVTEELYSLAVDVLTRWDKEKAGEKDVGRVLPSDYLWFRGDGANNHFRNSFNGTSIWDWSLPNPYDS